jgi:deoxycytidine triphosphate deaminase/intein/homing endonuclease
VVLSDRQIKEALDDGSVIIEPLAENAVQPSSVDLHTDRYFRVFRNDHTPYIDPKAAQEDLTELVEVADGEAFILHPGEFVLGSTLERVALGNDLVARLEGKSSLGRLGLLIHSSLPASETVMIKSEEGLKPMPIGEVVAQELQASVVGFDPETFEVGYHEITGWYEGPADRIFEVRLASGRSVRVTAGHNFFSLDSAGNLKKTRTGELREGTQVAIPRIVPDPAADTAPVLCLAELIPEDQRYRFTAAGPSVERLFERCSSDVLAELRAHGLKHTDYYRSRSLLPVPVLDQFGEAAGILGPDDRLTVKGARHSVPAQIHVDQDFAWMLGMFVAEGSNREGQFTISNTDQEFLDRLERCIQSLGITVYRAPIAVTGCSSILSSFFDWIGGGRGAHNKRVPSVVFSWPTPLIRHFMNGLIDGDGNWGAERISYFTCSDGLAGDFLFLAERLGRRAGSTVRQRGNSRLWQLYMPTNEHKLLTSVPLPDRLLVELREGSGLSQAQASREAGYRHATDLCNLERRSGREAVRMSTLQRLRYTYARRAECSPSIERLNRIVDGDLLWDRVVEIRDTGQVEPIYDLEVRPNGKKIENFLAGNGGVFVSNTAGFVDAGWDGHLTLELSNVANLPIAIYPGMKIGQISFLQMTSEAEHPYGSNETGSKYKGQQGPTPSRYYLNFPESERKG